MLLRLDEVRTWALFTCILTAISLFTTITHLFPHLSLAFIGQADTNAQPDGWSLQRRASGKATTLRILCLGASIMSGSMAFDENGFRKILKDKLVGQGFKVNYVGSRIGGTMLDNSLTAWGGYRIDEVAKKAELSYAYMPNVILVQCGSNDFFQNFHIDAAPDRLEALIDRMFTAVPGVMVVASTLLPNYNEKDAKKFAVFNDAVKAMVIRKAAAGQRVSLADFSTSEWSIADIRPPPDGTHPTDEGFVKMAGDWYGKIMKAIPMIIEPVDIEIPNYDEFAATSCARMLENQTSSVQIQQHLIGLTDDGNYVHSAVAKGELTQLKALGASESAISARTLSAGVFWADINGDGKGLDDYVYVDGSNSIVIALNRGNGIFGTSFKTEYGGSCSSSDTRFADINADGRDDLFCLSAAGELTCWLNKAGSNKDSPRWTSLGVVKDAVSGYMKDDIRLGDIDGDGRVDYITLDENGDVYAWRNGGVQDKPTNWTSLGLIKAASVGPPPLTEVQYPTSVQYDIQFVDINGDGRDDLLSIDNNGHVYTLINQRGHDIGLAPTWLDAGLTHDYTNLVVTNATQVRFGRIWGSKSTTGLKMADFTQVSATGVISTWENTGVGGTRLKADGGRYCDMFGSKYDDYVWMDYDGSLTLFGNTHSPPQWKEYGKIHPGGIALRDRVYLVDLDGDGRCDYVIVNETQGALQWQKNLGFDQTFHWGPLKNVNNTDAKRPVPVYCEWGSQGVRFADISGYGYLDYLCVAKNGSVHLWQNQANLADMSNVWFMDMGYVKDTEGFDRSEIHFADIDGNGRDDYLAVDRFDGSIQAWTSGNSSLNTVGEYIWTARGKIMDSVGARGENIAFANLGGFGRADFIDVIPETGDASTMFNICPRTSAGQKLGRNGASVMACVAVVVWALYTIVL